MKNIEVIKKSVEAGAKLINNSWGNSVMTEKEFNYQKDASALWRKLVVSDETKERYYMTYEDHKRAMTKLSNATAINLIVAIDELIESKEVKQDFLFLQAAGNGLTRYNQDGDIKGEPIEKRSIDTILGARASGYFTNINEETYQLASLNGNLNNDLDEILDHIMIVGGVEKLPDGSYKSSDWAGYGGAVDIVAPAENIYVDGDKINGTSFSTPMVTGAAALIWASDKDLSAGKVKHRLLDSTVEYVAGVEGDPRRYPLLNATAFIDRDEALDTSVYDALIDTYRTAIEEEWDMAQQHEGGIGLEYHHDYKGAGYEIRDLNHDGVPEMIVGSNDSITAIYTLDDMKPELIFAEGIRNTIHLYDYGVMEYDGIYSIAQGEHGSTYYILNKEGEVEIKDGYVYSESEEVYKNIKDWEVPPTKEAENELMQYVEELDETYKEPIQPTYTPFIEV